VQPGTIVRTGVVNPNFGFAGGGIQFDLLLNGDIIFDDSIVRFINLRPLP